MGRLTQWDRLVRYVSVRDGQVHYGEPIVDERADIDQLAADGLLRVKVLEGSSAISATPTGEEDQVKKLLGPLVLNEVPFIRCTGLNYKTHSEFIHRPTLAVKCKPKVRVHYAHIEGDSRRGKH